MEANRGDEERVGECLEGGRQNLIRSKTNRGKESVKEQEKWLGAQWKKDRAAEETKQKEIYGLFNQTFKSCMNLNLSFETIYIPYLLGLCI